MTGGKLKLWPMRSTTGPVKHSGGEHRRKCLPTNYTQVHDTVLRRPIESAQYTSKDFANLCRDLGVTQSMGAVGTSADNALAESFNAALKREVLQDHSCWDDAATCRREMFRWLVRYNTKRRHSHCCYVSPVNYERTRTADTLPEAA